MLEMKKTKRYTLVLLFLSSFSSPAFACMTASSLHTGTPKETVESAKNIHLVVLRSAQRHDTLRENTKLENHDSISSLAAELRSNSTTYIHYNFDVVETIEGTPTNSLQISLPFSPILERSPVTNNHHIDSKFWTNEESGRAILIADCLLSANFNFSDKYLLVLPEKPTRKSFERIEGMNDKWLKYVRETSLKLRSEE